MTAATRRSSRPDAAMWAPIGELVPAPISESIGTWGSFDLFGMHSPTPCEYFAIAYLDDPPGMFATIRPSVHARYWFIEVIDVAPKWVTETRRPILAEAVYEHLTLDGYDFPAGDVTWRQHDSALYRRAEVAP